MKLTGFLKQFFHCWWVGCDAVELKDKKTDELCALGCSCNKIQWMRADIKKLVAEERQRKFKWRQAAGG